MPISRVACVTMCEKETQIQTDRHKQRLTERELADSCKL